MTFGTILYTIFLRPLLIFFEFLFIIAQRFTSNPGLSIIVLSVVMNFLVLPLYKRADAMQAEERDTEAKLHKGLAHIKKVFSGDERMMIQNAYYRQNHYRPTDAFKGSVSLFLEIPFFIAAYQFLSNLELLNGVSFGPIANLGAQDGLLNIGGMAVNVLPILMTTVNLISCVIYTKGFPLKTKIQLYAMAIFFLFFLYNSPSGLVFYWTLNNIFSLIKTIFYKLKHPGFVLAVLASITGICFAVYGGFISTNLLLNNVILVSFGVILQFPLLWTKFIKKKINDLKEYHPDFKMFLLSALLLAVIMGILIPSAVINSSPEEFVDVNYYHHPLWYVVSAFCIASGTFMIWFSVFYWLAKPKGKVLFERGMWTLCGVSLLDYMFFATKMGIMSSTLSFENSFSFSKIELLANAALILLMIIVMVVTYMRYKKFVAGALATGLIAVGAMGGYNMWQINAATADLKTQVSQVNDATPHFTLSTTGKNVVVIMLDRAQGSYIPYIFNEKSELTAAFDGFTYYANTSSYGWHTNFASPALFGGYEYTPVELNKRSNDLLVTKQNEALKVMPVLFEQNGFDVTVTDAPYANYKWIPDMSIYDDYSDIHTYLTDGNFNDTVSKEQVFSTNCRNFFCYSVMKSAPVALQRFLYNNGKYNAVTNSDAYGSQSVETKSTASGISSTFMNAYNVLKNLSTMTQITDDEQGGFLMMTNDTTHEPTLLQEPDYVPAATVDNTEYDAENTSRWTVNGITMKMDDSDQYSAYEANMAAMLQLANWFDYLREQGVYDNTRIILVSDHAAPEGQFDGMLLKDSSGNTIEDMQAYAPLLMVKDFNATGFTTSYDYMTNADTPTLAMTDVISSLVNPFTGNEITTTEKTAHRQYVTGSNIYAAWENNGTQFLPGNWYSIADDIHVITNWKQEAKNSVNP